MFCLQQNTAFCFWVLKFFHTYLKTKCCLFEKIRKCVLAKICPPVYKIVKKQIWSMITKKEILHTIMFVSCAFNPAKEIHYRLVGCIWTTHGEEGDFWCSFNTSSTAGHGTWTGNPLTKSSINLCIWSFSTEATRSLPHKCIQSFWICKYKYLFSFYIIPDLHLDNQ